jgi:NADH-quinone oxidoreductase subunit G
LDVDLGVPTVEAARAELLRLGTAQARSAAPSVSPGAAPSPGDGQAVLATWHELIDAGRMQDGDEYYAGTAKPVSARVSAATAESIGIRAGDHLAVSTDRGAIVAPLEIAEMPDGVVWLPTNARGCAVRATLGASFGSLVRLTRSEAPPVVGEGA